MSGLRSLALFGMLHFDDPDKVDRELASFLEDPDVVFVEQPRKSRSFAQVAGAFLRAPLGAFGLLLLSMLVQAPPMLVLHRDLRPTESIAAERVHERRGVPTHAVDEGPWPRLARVGLATTLANWAVLLGIAWATPVGVATTGTLLLAAIVPYELRRRGHRTISILAACGWFLALAGLVVAYVGTLSYLSVSLLLAAAVAGELGLRRSVADRNELMLDRIEDLAEAEGYDEGMILTGKGHLGGLVRSARGHGIDVPRAHVSTFRSEGETHEPADPAVLPALGEGRRSGRVVDPDGEREGLRPRLVAALVDATVLFLVAFLTFLLLVIVGAELVGPPLPFPENLLLVLVAFVGLPLASKTFQEWNRATTAGKEPQGLAVADATDGTAPSLRAALLRNLLWPVDALGVGLLAMAATDRNRRLGDLLAGTVVGRDVTAGEDEATGDEDETAADDEPATGTDDRDDAGHDPAGDGRPTPGGPSD